MRKMTRPCDKKIKTVGCVETVAKLERGKKMPGREWVIDRGGEWEEKERRRAEERVTRKETRTG